MKKTYLAILIAMLLCLSGCGFYDENNIVISSVTAPTVTKADNSATDTTEGMHISTTVPVGTSKARQTVQTKMKSSTGTTKGPDSLDILRKSIENTYSVMILYGSETYWDSSGGDADFIQLNDANYIKVQLNILDKELGKYPKGFFSELSRKLRIFLVVSFSDQYDGMASYDNPDYFALYLSTDPESVRTLHHEIMHMIDFTMQEKSGYGGFSDWDSLNPPDFQYSGQDYTQSGYVFDKIKDISYCYFVTNYSLKSDFEDRAEIFADIMTDNNVSYYTSSDNPIRRKIEYLCSEIRRTFQSVGAVPTAEWEKNS